MTGDRGRALRALRHRDFRLIAIGNMVSQLGFWGQYVGVGWAATTLTDSDLLVTICFAVQWLPALLLSLIAGVWADRYDRRRLIMFGNLAMVAPPLAIGLLIQFGTITITTLIVLVLLGGAGQAFTQPAASAFVPMLVPDEDIPSAVALNVGMSNSTRVVGPALAGALIAAWGVAWGFHINAASFLAVTAACAVVSTRPGRPAQRATGAGAELKLGLAYTRRHRAVGRLLLFIAVNSFWMMHAALLPIFAEEVLGGGPGTYGYLSAGPGIGFVGAAVLTTMVTRADHRRAALVVASFGVAASLMVLSLSRHTALSVGVLGLFGFCQMIMTTIVTTLLIAASDDEYRGRVMGVFATCAVGVFPINSVMAGLLAEWLGPTTTVFLCSIAIAIFNVVFFASGSLAVIRDGTAYRRPQAAPATSDVNAS